MSNDLVAFYEEAYTADPRAPPYTRAGARSAQSARPTT